MQIDFTMTVNETKAYLEFVNGLTPKQKKNGVDVTFRIGSGIGIGVTVRCGKIRKDITDYASW